MFEVLELYVSSIWAWGGITLGIAVTGISLSVALGGLVRK